MGTHPIFESDFDCLTDLMSDKRALRKLVKLRLVPNPSDFGHLESQSKILVEKMRSRNEWINAKKIAMYLPLKDEPNIDRLISEGKSAGKVIGVPVYSKTDMHFVELVSNLEDLPVDKNGIRTEKNENIIQNFDLIIVPGRAFTLSGARCGRGGGYYDRFLASQNCPKIALAFSEQIFPEIPTNEYDEKVDLV